MQNQKFYFRTLSLIHLALISGQLGFIVAAFFINGKTDLILQANDDIFFFVIPGFAVMALMAGSMVFKKLIENTKNQAGLTEKMSGYRAALIVRYALTEAPSIFAIVGYILSGNLFYLIIAGLIIIYFITLKPTQEKLETDLNLDYKEKDELIKILS